MYVFFKKSINGLKKKSTLYLQTRQKLLQYVTKILRKNYIGVKREHSNYEKNNETS
jgi:hypothetical protein